MVMASRGNVRPSLKIEEQGAEPMSNKSRHRITMAVGATIAGAAIPIATAFTAWAETDYIDISYDGKTLFDNFPGVTSMFGASDAGTYALSGTNNDYAEVYGPANDNVVGLANDSASTDSGDTAIYDGVGTTTAPSAGAFFGNEGAQRTNATNSDAEVYGGGNAVIDPASFGGQDAVSNSVAYSTNGGTTLISNDGNEPGLTTMTGDYASANGGNIGGLANSSTVGEILDSNNSVSVANDTGFNPTSLEGGSAVDLANNSSAYAINLGSAANVEGGVVNGVPLTNDVPITGASNSVGDGSVFVDSTSNLFQIDGIPDATFFADLFGAGGAAAFTTAWTDLLQLF
jgi:hypothetical protein